MFSLLAFLIVGGLAGWIASKIMGTDAQQGLMMNIIVGIVGAFVGGLLFSFIAGDGISVGNSLDFTAILVSIAGACVVLWLYKMVTSGKRTV